MHAEAPTILCLKLYGAGAHPDAAIFPVSTVSTLAMTYIEPPATGTRSEMGYGSLSALELEDLPLDLRV